MRNDAAGLPVLDKWRRELTLMFGEPAWWGGDSDVWNMGRYVIKLMSIDVELYRNQRLLMRRSGPYARIADIMVVGWQEQPTFMGSIDIIALVVQERIIEHWRAYPDDQWHDGVDAWMMFDGTNENAVGDYWVDTVDIRPVKALDI